MDPAEFQGFEFDFGDTDSKSRQPQREEQLSRRKSLHVKWASLPRPDHETGTIVYSSPANRAEGKDFNHSAYTINARRRSARVNALETLRDAQWSFEHQSEHGKRKGSTRSISAPPDFDEVRWHDDPHPGIRIPVDVFEGESVSPRSSAVVMTMWCTEMDATMFRARVQPSRVTGRRKPGMTAHLARPARTAKEVRKKGGEMEEEDFCRVQ